MRLAVASARKKQVLRQRTTPQGTPQSIPEDRRRVEFRHAG